jgi:hypothetical protein
MQTGRAWIGGWLLAAVLGCGSGTNVEDAPAAAGPTAIPVAAPNASGASFPGQSTPTFPEVPDPQQMPKMPIDPFDPGPIAPPPPSAKPKGTTL